MVGSGNQTNSKVNSHWPPHRGLVAWSARADERDIALPYEGRENKNLRPIICFFTTAEFSVCVKLTTKQAPNNQHYRPLSPYQPSKKQISYLRLDAPLVLKRAASLNLQRVTKLSGSHAQQIMAMINRKSKFTKTFLLAINSVEDIDPEGVSIFKSFLILVD